MINNFKTYLTNNRGYSIHTATAYGKDLHDFAKWARMNMKTPTWSSVQITDIMTYVSDLHEQGKSVSTINRHISSIRQFFNYLKKNGQLKENPARYIESLKRPYRIVNTIPTEAIQKALQKATGTIRIMLLILSKTGVRVQEMLDIEVQDIETQNGRIRIHGKGQKERYVYMRDAEIREVAEYAQGRPSRIFGEITQRQVRTAVYETLRYHTNARQLSPHAIRHTFATNMAKNGANVTTIATILGHESIKTTQKYIDLGQNNIREQQLKYSQFN